MALQSAIDSASGRIELWNPGQPHGFVFMRCNVTAQHALPGSNPLKSLLVLAAFVPMQLASQSSVASTSVLPAAPQTGAGLDALAIV